LDAATLLAHLPPFDLLAAERKNIFDRTLDAKILGIYDVEMGKEFRLEERSRLLDLWWERLGRPDVAGAWTVHGILPHFEEWMAKKWGGLSFHLTQLLSNHGCFGAFLHRIDKQPSGPGCFHCGLGVSEGYS